MWLLDLAGWKETKIQSGQLTAVSGNGKLRGVWGDDEPVIVRR